MSATSASAAVASSSSRGAGGRPSWFVRGDVDGFFGLALDNLVQLLLIDALCRGVLGFPNELVWGRVLPGAAVSLLVGNLYYAWQARRIARAAGRDDVCALPYGINTVSLFAYVFLVMLPVKLEAQSHGVDPAAAATLAWKAGLVACTGAALIEFAGAFVAERIRRSSPRAALLSTLAGIALGFIALGFVFRAFARPLVGLTTLAIVLLTYFGRVRFRGGLPGGAVAVAVGALLAHATGITTAADTTSIGLHPPLPVVGDLLDALRSGHWLDHAAVILPMGLFTVVGSLQNIESAEAAGDSFPTRSSLVANGVGSFAAALFGSCFPTTLYIGHPGWKALGARTGYSTLNGLAMALLCFTGALSWVASVVPIDAGMAIVIWIGLVITAQSFQAVPREHAPAVVVGLLPGVAAWGVLMAKQGVAAASGRFGPDLVAAFHRFDNWIDGGFALEQGFILTSMVLAAATVHVIERRFTRAAAWCFAAALLAATGLLHSYRFTEHDTALSLTPAWPFVAGYGAMGLCFLLAPWITRPGEGH